MKVLFLEAQATPASDSRMHSLLMRSYDRGRVDVHAACHRGNGVAAASLKDLQSIPHLAVLPTDFGPSIRSRSRLDLARASAPAARDLSHLALYVKQQRIDVIHASSRPRDAAVAVVLGKLSGARVVIHLHLKYDTWFRRPMRWALRQSDGILAVSRFVAQSVVTGGYPADRVYHVLNGLDASAWDPSLDGTSLRQEFGISPEAPLLAVTSRLFYWKGHTDLLRALALVRQSDPRVKLLVVGEDDGGAHPGGGSYRAELEQLAQELGLADTVIFAGFRSDIPRILAACDIYAMPSFEEPCAVAFLEAMAMERPVVALDSGGTPELVEHGKSGLLSPPHAIEELAANILTLIDDPATRRRMGKHGRTRVEQYYSPRRMADEVEGVYRSILNGRR